VDVGGENDEVYSHFTGMYPERFQIIQGVANAVVESLVRFHELQPRCFLPRATGDARFIVRTESPDN
jgi:hypothetical protein